MRFKTTTLDSTISTINLSQNSTLKNTIIEIKSLGDIAIIESKSKKIFYPGMLLNDTIVDFNNKKVKYHDFKSNLENLQIVEGEEINVPLVSWTKFTKFGTLNNKIYVLGGIKSRNNGYEKDKYFSKFFLYVPESMYDHLPFYDQL